MGRFIVCDYDEAKHYEDPDDWLAFGHGMDFCNYLVDFEEGIVIFCDCIEDFEQTQLNQGLQPLVRYLEKVAAE